MEALQRHQAGMPFSPNGDDKTELACCPEMETALVNIHEEQEVHEG